MESETKASQRSLRSILNNIIILIPILRAEPFGDHVRPKAFFFFFGGFFLGFSL